MKGLIEALKKQSWVFWFWVIAILGIIFYIGFRFGYAKAIYNCVEAFS